jgi:hypothetical protein
MDFEGKVSLQENVAAAAPEVEEQSRSRPAVVEEPAKVNHPDLTALLAVLEHERIAALAYFLWQQRGCPEGSPEEDWFQAQKHIREDR